MDEEEYLYRLMNEEYDYYAGNRKEDSNTADSGVEEDSAADRNGCMSTLIIGIFVIGMTAFGITA